MNIRRKIRRFEALELVQKAALNKSIYELEAVKSEFKDKANLEESKKQTYLQEMNRLNQLRAVGFSPERDLLEETLTQVKNSWIDALVSLRQIEQELQKKSDMLVKQKKLYDNLVKMKDEFQISFLQVEESKIEKDLSSILSINRKVK